VKHLKDQIFQKKELAENMENKIEYPVNEAEEINEALNILVL
jgi:hypothetical protein